MADPLAALQPRSLWEHFSSILSIPRPSKHEERIVAWVRSVAEQHGWEIRSDEAGNLVLAVPPSSASSDAPIVVLQAHLDMVCEKNGDVDHDFMKDPIRPRLVDGWVYASGTTLGADNGIGVAAALAAATDPSVVHGPLELLFTLDEETGLTGAQNLDGSILKGRLLVNLDSEEDGKLCVGCAGGADADVTMLTTDCAPDAAAGAWRLRVSGLRGGHSGINIHENRGNAIKILTRTLRAALDREIELSLCEIDGGSRHNAIPREADATLTLVDAEAAKLESCVGEMVALFSRELQNIDDELTIVLERLETKPERCLSQDDGKRLLNLLAALPHGVLGMSPDVPGLVETSNNLASIRTTDGRIDIKLSARSSVGSAMDATIDRIRAIGRLAGAEVETRNGYPGWKPDLDSRALHTVRRVWEKFFETTEVTAIHAGLECGLLGEKVPDMDMISVGPQIEGPHSPGERVQVASVERFWHALKEALADFARA